MGIYYLETNIGIEMSELLIESAEKDRQTSLDKVFIAKFYPDATQVEFRGNAVYISGEINTKRFRGIELFVGNNPNFTKSVVSARLWHTVKRPGRPTIKVYSKVIYGLTIEHIVNMVNDMSPKSVMGKIGHVLKMQESGLAREFKSVRMG